MCVLWTRVLSTFYNFMEYSGAFSSYFTLPSPSNILAEAEMGTMRVQRDYQLCSAH
jgi:hypothetical protein